MTAVAAIFAHPDDEVLACGATLARHAAEGRRVHVLILASGLDARGMVDDGARLQLRAEAAEAARRLGAEAPVLAGLPDNRLDSLALLDVVKVVESFIDAVQPEIVYTHHRGDLNIDHRVTHDAVLTACRPLPGASVRRILAGEVLSSSEWQSPAMAPFQPTLFVDAGQTLAAKLAAMEAYAGELRLPPHPRSLDGIRTQARLRGLQAGMEAAEAFITVRELW